MNIVGDSATGKYNFVVYNFTQPINISTFNSSLCSVLTPSSTGLTILTYRPGAPILPFTQFLPGSGYIIRAKENFTIPQQGEVLPLSSTIQILGNSASGRYNIKNYYFTEAVNINTFNASLCAVLRPSSTQQTILTYRPGAPILPFTQFAPGSGYLIRAKENFNITGTILSFNAYDDANQAAYNDGWITGDNGGLGFTPWNIFTTGEPNSAEVFIGSSVVDGFGNIDVNNKSWGSFGKIGSYANAERGLAAPLTVGSTLSGILAIAFRNGNKGFNLYSSSTDFSGENELINFNVGGDSYALAGNFLSWNYAQDSVFEFYASQTTENTYDFTLKRRATANPAQSPLQTILSNRTGRIRGLKFYIGDTNANVIQPLDNLFFNSLSIYGPEETPTESQTQTPTESQTQTPTESQTQTPTESQTQTPTESQTQTPTESQTQTPTESQTQTPTESQTQTQTETPTETPTETQTETQTPGIQVDSASEGYDGEWNTGDNGGAGFQPWVIYSIITSVTGNADAGTFITNGESLGFTELDTTTWGLTAYPGEDTPNFINAERLLSQPLVDGDTFIVDIGANFRNGEKGISFFKGGNFSPENEIFNFNVGSGTPSGDRYNTNGLNLDPAVWPYNPTSQFKFYYFQENNQESTLFITRGAALTSFELDGTLTGFRLYNGNTNNQEIENALLIGALQIYRQIPVEVPTPTETPTPTQTETESPEPILEFGTYTDVAENYGLFPSNDQFLWNSGSNFGSWDNPNNNDIIGYGPWTLYADSAAGHTIVGTTVSQAYNLETAAWCLTGAGNDYSNAERSITIPLTTGDIFRIELGVDFRNGNKGIDLFTNNQFNDDNKLMNFRVDSDSYYVVDANNQQTEFTNWTYGPSSKIVIEVEHLSSSLFAIFSQFNSNSTLRNLSSVELPFSLSGSNITGFKLYCSSSDNAASGGLSIQNALLANVLQVTRPTMFDTSFYPISLSGIAPGVVGIHNQKFNRVFTGPNPPSSNKIIYISEVPLLTTTDTFNVSMSTTYRLEAVYSGGGNTWLWKAFGLHFQILNFVESVTPVYNLSFPTIFTAISAFPYFEKDSRFWTSEIAGASNGVAYFTNNTNAVIISEAGSSEINGTYIETGTYNNKKYYNKVGFSVTDQAAISWDGAFWNIYDEPGDVSYESGENVAFPWQVTTWSTAVNGIVPLPILVPTII